METAGDDCVTLRERDSTNQVRLPKTDVTSVVIQIVHKKLTWEKVMQMYPAYESKEEEGATQDAANGDPTKIEKSTRASFRRPVSLK